MTGMSSGTTTGRTTGGTNNERRRPQSASDGGDRGSGYETTPPVLGKDGRRRAGVSGRRCSSWNRSASGFGSGCRAGRWSGPRARGPAPRWPRVSTPVGASPASLKRRVRQQRLSRPGFSSRPPPGPCGRVRSHPPRHPSEADWPFPVSSAGAPVPRGFGARCGALPPSVHTRPGGCRPPAFRAHPKRSTGVPVKSLRDTR